MAEIDWATARGFGPDTYPSQARRAGRRPAAGIQGTVDAFESFSELKKRRGIIDFDDVLSEVDREARRDPEFAATLRWRFRHLLVDEAQDLNPLQHRLVDLLRKGRDDLFLVGDPAQSIYGFNGADAATLVEVEDRFPGIEVIRLPVNHRCTPQIVSAGLHVLSSGGQPQDLRSARADGPTLTLLTGDDEEVEADLVATEIARRDQNLVRSGELAVLARTHAQLGVLEAALAARGVAVRRSSTAKGSPTQEAMQTAAALTTSSQLRAWAHDTLEDIDALEAAEAVVAAMENADRRVSSADRRDARRAHEVIAAERRVAAAVLDYVRDQPMGNGAGFRSWVATTNPFRDRSREGVELSTFHASKGREWHTVVVAGAETGLVPHRSAKTVGERAEEARLLYVALTRATDDLVVTHARRRGGYQRAITPLLADLDVGRTDVAPPPRELLRDRSRNLTETATSEALRAWRSDAARRANILPTELCTDRDLDAIAQSRPTTAEELADVTSMGLLTARRLAPQVLPLVDR